MARKKVPKKIRDFLLIASKHQCSICQNTQVDVHHIIPVSEGGTNDLDNLMVVCPNHHRDFHDGKLTADQMRTYRTQWLQKCAVFLEIQIPTGKLIKDREAASKLSIDTKIQFLEESTNAIIETISVDDNVSIFYKSGAATPSEINKDVINLLQLSYRLFKNCKKVNITFPQNTRNQLLLGIDLPEIFSCEIKMNDIDKFVFGKFSLKEFWKKITFYRKQEPDVTNNLTIEVNIPLVI